VEAAVSAAVAVLAALAAVVPGVAARAEVGKVGGISMTPEKLIHEFVTRFQSAAGPNLQSILLYGSAASGSFDPKFSNINLLCILKDTSYPVLRSVTPIMQWWYRQEQVAPLIMSREELTRSTDVFTIELVDMQRQHKVLSGEDVLESLMIPMHLHRIQVEYELREKLLLLRQSVLLAANDRRRLQDLLLGSVPSFTTLFRHALIAIGEGPIDSRREAVARLAHRVGFDASAFLQVLDIREHKLELKHVDVERLCAGYLAIVEQVTSAVDRMLDTAAH
jgi:predicted nucleotidyltransferase